MRAREFLREFDPGPGGFGPFRLYMSMDPYSKRHLIGQFDTQEEAEQEMQVQMSINADKGHEFYYYIMDGQDQEVGGWNPADDYDAQRMASKIRYIGPGKGVAEGQHPQADMQMLEYYRVKTPYGREYVGQLIARYPETGIELKLPDGHSQWISRDYIQSVEWLDWKDPVLTSKKVSEGKSHISPSGVMTNMDPSDDDYEINYGPNGLVAKFRRDQGLDVRTGSKKVRKPK